MAVLENIEPKEVFRFFEEMCQIPRGTFDTKRISDYCVAFAKERNLEVIQDEVNNVIIKKPGTAGYEDSEPVILQGHLDMVCEKRPDSAHDFSKDPIELVVDGDSVRAKDTTLGGDDGIAVAMALAVLDSTDIPHPPIEAVFTIDEEVGMGGAIALDMSGLKAHKVLNIDSEVEGILTTGCSGGFTCTTEIPVTRKAMEGTVVRIKIHGLQGVHSGIEINKQRGNAHKMMGRLLNRIAQEEEISLIRISGGAKDNVIAMECTAEFFTGHSDEVKKAAEEMKAVWDNEFMGDEPTLMVDVEVEEGVAAEALDRESTDRVISYIVICPNGVQTLARKLDNLVETSLNLGILATEDSVVRSVSLIRSSVESKKVLLREQMEQCAKLVSAKTSISNEYPAWQYNPNSELLELMNDTYKELFGKEPVISAVHAGLECGMFLGKRPDLDCVSFGPDIPNVHSFNESVDIASTERMWNYLKAILARLK